MASPARPYLKKKGLAVPQPAPPKTTAAYTPRAAPPKTPAAKTKTGMTTTSMPPQPAPPKGPGSTTGTPPSKTPPQPAPPKNGDSTTGNPPSSPPPQPAPPNGPDSTTDGGPGSSAGQSGNGSTYQEQSLDAGDYAEGEAGYQGRIDDVGDVAAGMMAKDSVLMKKARADGAAFANRRGLLNSSMAGGAAESAMLDQIVPMASQTAQQRFQKNLSGQQYLEKRGLNDQTAEQQKDQTRLEGRQQRKTIGAEYDARGELSEQESQQRRQEAAQQQRFTMRQMRLDANVQSRLQREGFNQDKVLANVENAFKTRQAALDRRLQRQLADKEITAEAQKGAETMVSNIFNDYEDSVRSVLNNPDIGAKQRNQLLNNAKTLMQKKMDLVTSIHSETFDWPKVRGVTTPSAKRKNGGGNKKNNKKSNPKPAPSPANTSSRDNGDRNRSTLRDMMDRATARGRLSSTARSIFD